MKNLVFISFSVAIALMVCFNQTEGQYVWTKDPAPVLTPAQVGTGHTWVWFPSILYNADSSRYEMWFSVDSTIGSYHLPWQIAFAASKDGLTWNVVGSGPVLRAIPGTWEAVVCNPSVLREGGVYKMWYSPSASVYGPDSCFVAYATSPDGITWTRYANNPVLRPGPAAWEYNVVADATVTHTGGLYTMWYDAGPSNNTSIGRIGRATSTDGIHWTKDSANNPILDMGGAGQWDQGGVSFPRVFSVKDTLFMCYDAGNPLSVGLARSTNGGAAWQKLGTGPVLSVGSSGSWDHSLVQDGPVLTIGNTLHMWYGGNAYSVSAIGHATSPLPGVRHLVPHDYATIQAAINASNNGDTVLVSEGTYKENIRYRGKAITVASLYLIDGDTTHIAKTIIDGSGSTIPDSGSVVYFINGEDTTSVLCGFTIQGGSGTRYHFNGPTFNLWAWVGGGVYCLDAGPRIVRNTITRNRVVGQVAGGGGVEAFGTRSHLPYLILESNRISDNYAENDTSSTNWWGWAGGADIEMNARIVGNVFDRDSVVGNSGAYIGGLGLECYNADSSLLSAYIAGNVFRSNFLSAKIQGAVAAGLEVFGTGNVTIQNNLFESNSATKSGGGGWAEGGGLLVDDKGITGYGRKMIVGNQFLNSTVDAPVENYGGGVLLYYTTATLSGNTFRNNIVVRGNYGGAGIGIQNSSFRLENNIFSGNSTAADGGALLVNAEFAQSQTGTEQAIVNNTFVNNHAAGHGGALCVNNASNLALLNNILWDDTSSGRTEIYGAGYIAGVAYCDVKGGWTGTGNIDADPGFVDTMYHLNKTSLCIGRGIDSLQIGEGWYHRPANDYDGHPRPMPLSTHPDMGAQEELITGVSIGQATVPVQFELSQNFPNPFNPSTTIQYALPRRTHVSLSVYNTLGQLVSTLVNGEEQAGYHEAKFDGRNLASGVYFYRLQAGSFVKTMKLVILR